MISLPAALSRSLTLAGYNRACVFLTDEGILLKPYAGSKKDEMLELPEWKDE